MDPAAVEEEGETVCCSAKEEQGWPQEEGRVKEEQGWPQVETCHKEDQGYPQEVPPQLRALLLQGLRGFGHLRTQATA
jgi:hypothetical protein